MNMDPIFDVLEVDTEPFAICEIRGDCNVGMKGEPSATLHYILDGEGEVLIKGRPKIKMRTGTLVLVPSFTSHILHNLGNSKIDVPACQPAALQLERILKESSIGENSGGQLLALCARIHIGLKDASDLIHLIHEPIVEYATETNALHKQMENLLNELRYPQMGSRAMIRAILLQSIIDMLRRNIVSPDHNMRWMAALKDPSIWGALRLMLDHPGDQHSVDSLAAVVGMSRATFAKRFSDAYGSGPIELLRELRMRRAASLLEHTDMPVKRIAEIVGFASRSAFTRQFEVSMGLSPREYKKTRRTPPKE